MYINSLFSKLRRRVKGLFLQKIWKTKLQFAAYPSFWHYQFSKNVALTEVLGRKNYLTQKPNAGAGIGHQLANWNSGYYYAKCFDLNFSHSKFSKSTWEQFLGFGEREKETETLEQNAKVRKVQLPKFDEREEREVAMIKNIIESYRDRDTLFYLELDQGYKRQCDTYDELSKKYFAANSRKNDKLFYNNKDFNIAIHIRRGDIVSSDKVIENRWMANDYYVKILQQVLKVIPEKNYHLYLFSQGDLSQFKEFEIFDNLTYCLDTEAIETFSHLVAADLLICSKSSFSYKPALISRGIKLVPSDFWHSYPENPDYVQVDRFGGFDKDCLKKALDHNFGK